ncbi:MAG: KR domain-containing protein, partial [Candidatus Dadabacteria bacterium]|nr:KR domain-containing protein [Candidatus Dadabacteria bacterium]
AEARIHGIVHNAGITRDKLLVNTDAQRWGQVLQVNLAAQLPINEVLLGGRPGGLADVGSTLSFGPKTFEESQRAQEKERNQDCRSHDSEAHELQL